jgi:hypothetical protein
MGAMSSNDNDFEQLAWAVAEDGPSAHDAELTRLAATARGAGVAFVAADVVADRAAPPVARQRALAAVVAALTSVSSGSAAPLHAVA